MKYIDANKFLAELRKMINAHMQKREDMIDAECHSLADEATTRACELLHVFELIASLQQEQSEVELDNHAIMEEIRKCGCNPNEFDIARHFFELGFNARKEK